MSAGLCGLLLVFVGAAEALAQYRFDYWTTDNGLPQNQVAAITQTRDGYLWFATADGLVRCDNCPTTANPHQEDSDNDGAGDARETATFNFTGFFQPVDNLPAINVATAGSAIPVKFSLGGNHGLDIFAPGHPASGPIACGSAGALDEIETTVTAGGSSLSYDAATDTYTYVWKTNKAWKGTCRQLVVKFLSDDSTHVASFRFR